MGCEHPLCEIIGGACSLATRRSRGCRPNIVARGVAPEVFDEVRGLLAAIAPAVPDAEDGPRAEVTDAVRAAATRLAAIVRREALEDRNLVALAAEDEPELAPALARLCRRRQAV